MTKTELLALAERLESNALSMTDINQAAAILRKLAALEPVAWIDSSGHPKHLTHYQSATEHRLYGPLRPLHNLAGIIDHE